MKQLPVSDGEFLGIVQSEENFVLTQHQGVSVKRSPRQITTPTRRELPYFANGLVTTSCQPRRLPIPRPSWYFHLVRFFPDTGTILQGKDCPLDPNLQRVELTRCSTPKAIDGLNPKFLAPLLGTPQFVAPCKFASAF